MSRHSDLAGVRQVILIIMLMSLGFGALVWAINIGESSPTGDLPMFGVILAILGVASFGASLWMMFRG